MVRGEGTQCLGEKSRLAPTAMPSILANQTPRGTFARFSGASIAQPTVRTTISTMQPWGCATPRSAMDASTPARRIKGAMNHVFVRPEGAASLLTSKRNTGTHQAATPDEIMSRFNSMDPDSGKTSITVKEDILECLMSREAYKGFDQVGRLHLQKHHMTRACVNPDQLQDAEKVSRPQGNNDLEDDILESDDELIAMGYFAEYQTQQASKSCTIPEALASFPGVRLGFGMADATATQDRLFTARCNALLLVGIVNSHGKRSVGTELARLVATEMPAAVFRSSALTRECNPARALSDAFCRLYRIAADFVDINLTGASVTVVLADPENITVAHVGDCRAVLAVPDPLPNAKDFHFKPVAVTQDHRLSVKHEFDRIQGCGGEMRKLVNDNVYRLFLKDQDVPGLALTRAIGHRLGHLVGVSHFPSINTLRRADLTEGAFLILGSGALWTMMSEKAAVNWVGRHYDDPKSAAEALSQEAMQRWKDESRPAKRSLHRDVDDCFSVAVLLLDHQARVHKPRPFMPGQHEKGRETKDWAEVKSIERTARMRRQQANGRPLAEDVILMERTALPEATRFTQTL